MVSLGVLGPGVCPGTLTLPALSGLLILQSSLGEGAQPKLLLLCPAVPCTSRRALSSHSGAKEAPASPAPAGTSIGCPPPQTEKSEPRRNPAGPGVLNQKQHPWGLGSGAGARYHPSLSLELGAPGGCHSSSRLLPLSESSPNYARSSGVGGLPETEVGRENE